MLRLVTVCRQAKAFIFYSGHPDVCTAIIIIIIIMIMTKFKLTAVFSKNVIKQLVHVSAVCRDIKQWKSLESTPEARVPGGELRLFRALQTCFISRPDAG